MKDSRFNWQVPSLPDVDIAELAKATQLDPIMSDGNHSLWP